MCRYRPRKRDNEEELAGRNSVMCTQRFHDSSKKSGIDFLIARLKSHEGSAEHAPRKDRQFDDCTQSSVFKDIEATMSSTLTAGAGIHEAVSLIATVSALQERRPEQHTTTPYVIDNDLPFSLLADGSSNDGVKWIVFLIRTVSPMNRPITFHLALVEIVSERADDIVNALTNILEELPPWAKVCGLKETPYNFFMNRMVALSSDDASVMSGEQNVCAARKLNLAVKPQDNVAFNLTIAVVTEMHHLFGLTLGTRGRAVYSATATEMGFPVLQMDALHADSPCIPRLIHALHRLAIDTSASPNIKRRAQAAAFALKDGRTFIILHHVNATLSHFAKFSEALQDDEALLIDFLSRWSISTLCSVITP
ncbi:hypothetical protein COOONC_01541 [Cooperia oncophora]